MFMTFETSLTGYSFMITLSLKVIVQPEMKVLSSFLGRMTCPVTI